MLTWFAAAATSNNVPLFKLSTRRETIASPSLSNEPNKHDEPRGDNIRYSCKFLLSHIFLSSFLMFTQLWAPSVTAETCFQLWIFVIFYDKRSYLPYIVFVILIMLKVEPFFRFSSTIISRFISEVSYFQYLQQRSTCSLYDSNAVLIWNN